MSHTESFELTLKLVDDRIDENPGLKGLYLGPVAWELFLTTLWEKSLEDFKDGLPAESYVYRGVCVERREMLR